MRGRRYTCISHEFNLDQGSKGVYILIKVSLNFSANGSWKRGEVKERTE